MSKAACRSQMPGAKIQCPCRNPMQRFEYEEVLFKVDEICTSIFVRCVKVKVQLPKLNAQCRCQLTVCRFSVQKGVYNKQSTINNLYAYVVFTWWRSVFCQIRCFIHILTQRSVYLGTHTHTARLQRAFQCRLVSLTQSEAQRPDR